MSMLPLVALLLGSSWTPCAVELFEHRGVWSPEGRFLPFYDDRELAGYLTALYRQPEAVVLPLYSADPLGFVAGNRVYVSTALVLAAASEAELDRALSLLPRLREPKHAVHPPVCGLPASGASFETLRARLGAEVAQYREWTERRLRTRLSTPAP